MIGLFAFLENPASPGPIWEYGLAVGVISAACGLIWWLLKNDREKMETITGTHAKVIIDIDEKHRDERKDWNQYAQSRDERITTVCDQLIKAIHETKSEK